MSRNTGANTQGKTLAETRENLKEAVELVLEANPRRFQRHREINDFLAKKICQDLDVPQA